MFERSHLAIHPFSLKYRNIGTVLLSGSRQLSWKWHHEQNEECFFVLEEEEEEEGWWEEGGSKENHMSRKEGRNNLVFFTI